MTILLGLLAVIFAIVSAGFGVITLVAGRRITPWECLALPWLLGTATVSIAIWITGFLFYGIVLQLLVTALCLSLGVIGYRCSQKFPAPDRRTTAPKIDKVCLALFVLELAAMFWLSFQHTLGWDGLTVWEMKAHFAFLNGGVLPADYFTDVARRFGHPEYPLLLPLTETWCYLWMGEADQFWIKLIFPIWYVATMSILFLAASEFSGKRWIGWIAVLLFPLVPCVYNAPGGVPVGYADLPIAAIYIAAVFYLLRFLRDNTRDAMSIFVVLAATLPWMKREGAVLWMAISLCGAVVIYRRRGFGLALLSFLPGIVVMAAWGFFLRHVHALPSRDFISISLATLKTNLPRIGAIAQKLVIEMSDLRAWDLFWVIAVVALVCVLVRHRSALTAALVWLWIAPLLCYCASYIFSAWPDLSAHIDTSLPRLLLQLTPVVWLVIALAIAPKIDIYSSDKAA